MPVNKDDDDYFSGKIAGEFEDFLLNEFTTLKKLDDFLKVFIFYHIERCEQDDCSQCYCAINLRYVVEHNFAINLRYVY